jgi:ribosomal protein S25
MKAAKARGSAIGRLTVVQKWQYDSAKSLVTTCNFVTVTSMAKRLGLSLGTASRLKRKIEAEIRG